MKLRKPFFKRESNSTTHVRETVICEMEFAVSTCDKMEGLVEPTAKRGSYKTVELLQQRSNYGIFRQIRLLDYLNINVFLRNSLRLKRGRELC